jgi:hypothetical protein
MKGGRAARPGEVAVVILAAFVAACGSGAPTVFTASYPDSHVSIAMRFEPASDSSGTLVATFTPDADGIHLYGAELPPEGIDGAGLPTLVKLTDHAWRTTGPLVASMAAEPVTLAGFDEPFPIYPDGPVTLRLPVERTTASGDAAIGATVTFMSCTSSGVCYLPVRDQSVEVPAR